MKRLWLPILVFLFVVSFAFAEGAPKSGDLGIQGGVVFTGVLYSSPYGTLGAKYYVTDSIALRAAVGLYNTSAAGGNTGYDVGVGFEYHFGVKGGVSPYAGAEISYSGESLSGGAAASSAVGIRAVLGGEYFFSNNFSWAGEIGLGYNSFYNPGPPATTTSTIGTVGLGSFLTYYF